MASPDALLMSSNACPFSLSRLLTRLGWAAVAVLFGSSLLACSREPEAGGDGHRAAVISEAAAFEAGRAAACHGPALTSAAAREAAMTEGYAIHIGYHCIERASWEQVQQQKAAWAAANPPELLAQRQAEREAIGAARRQAALEAREQAQREQLERAADRARDQARAMLPDHLPRYFPYIEVNTADLAELAKVRGLEIGMRLQILRERERGGLFANWADLTSRVSALLQRDAATRASLTGLVVNGLVHRHTPTDPRQIAGLLQSLPRRD